MNIKITQVKDQQLYLKCRPKHTDLRPKVTDDILSSDVYNFQKEWIEIPSYRAPESGWKLYANYKLKKKKKKKIVCMLQIINTVPFKKLTF